MRRRDDRAWCTHYARGLGISTRNNTIACGYSLGATGTFAVVEELHGADVATSFSIVSVSAAVGIAGLVAWAAPSWAAWICTPFVFTGVYLLAVGAEAAIAAAGHEEGGSD
jgi:hypothetical protein